MKALIIIAAASTALFAQGDKPQARSPEGSQGVNVRQLVESSIAATQRNWQARLRYTYLERYDDRRRDAAGRVQSENVSISRTVIVDGFPFEQLLEHNGRPPSVEEGRRQTERFDKLKQETPAHRTERLRLLEEENATLVRDVPKAFDFRLIGEEAVNGRPAYVLQATPRPRYRGQGKYGKMFAKVEGKLWVDKQDLGWIKVDGHVMQPFSMGLFLVRVLRGSHITMEQTRVDDGIWMPERVGVRAAAKILFIKDVVVERVLTYSEYRLVLGRESAAGGPGMP